MVEDNGPESGNLIDVCTLCTKHKSKDVRDEALVGTVLILAFAFALCSL